MEPISELMKPFRESTMGSGGISALSIGGGKGGGGCRRPQQSSMWLRPVEICATFKTVRYGQDHFANRYGQQGNYVFLDAFIGAVGGRNPVSERIINYLKLGSHNCRLLRRLMCMGVIRCSRVKSLNSKDMGYSYSIYFATISLIMV
jgi:hypothetical protein